MNHLDRILAAAKELPPEDHAAFRHGVAIWRESKGNRKMSNGNLMKPKSLDVALSEEIGEMGGSGFGQLLKFDANTKKYTLIGGEEVPPGRQYIAHVDQFSRGWVKFIEKQVVAVRIVRLVDGPAPEREDLDDLELIGKENDPWVFQRYLPLEDLEIGELVTFVGKSVGAKIAIGNILETFKTNYATRGRPIIALGIGTFKTRDYGERARPDFKIQDWTGTAPVHANNAPQGGPPPDDPNDPGYDLDLLPVR